MVLGMALSGLAWVRGLDYLISHQLQTFCDIMKRQQIVFIAESPTINLLQKYKRLVWLYRMVHKGSANPFSLQYFWPSAFPPFVFWPKKLFTSKAAVTASAHLRPHSHWKEQSCYLSSSGGWRWQQHQNVTWWLKISPSKNQTKCLSSQLSNWVDTVATSVLILVQSRGGRCLRSWQRRKQNNLIQHQHKLKSA